MNGSGSRQPPGGVSKASRENGSRDSGEHSVWTRLCELDHARLVTEIRTGVDCGQRLGRVKGELLGGLEMSSVLLGGITGARTSRCILALCAVTV